jgi:hypothetical protein
MAKNTDAWLKRAKEILAKGHTSHDTVPFAPSILAALYGPRSTHLEAFNRRLEEISRLKEGADFQRHRCAYATIENVVGEIENGLIENLRTRVAGEILGELVGLGKEILTDNTDSSKNVSAVLIAAAYDTRQFGAHSPHQVFDGRPKLEEVIGALKTSGILVGSEVSIAQS